MMQPIRKKATAGSWRPGQSGNPSGRAKRTAEEFELIRACKVKTPDALAVIERIMLHGENERNQLSAALSIIERAYGKAVERQEVRTGPLDDIDPADLRAAHEMVKAAIKKAKGPV